MIDVNSFVRHDQQSVALCRDAVSTRVILLQQPRYLRGTFDTSEKPKLLAEMKQQQAEIQEAEAEMKSTEGTHKEMKTDYVMATSPCAGLCMPSLLILHLMRAGQVAPGARQAHGYREVEEEDPEKD